MEMAGRKVSVAARDGARARARNHVAASENAGMAGHHVRADDHRAVRLELDARHSLQEAAVGLLAERQHHRVSLERLELAGRLWPASRIEFHDLDRQRWDERREGTEGDSTCSSRWSREK